jgi:hypothetical protein
MISKTHLIIGFAVLLAFILAILAMVLFCCLRQRRRLSHTAEAPPTNDANTISRFSFVNPRLNINSKTRSAPFYPFGPSSATSPTSNTGSGLRGNYRENGRRLPEAKDDSLRIPPSAVMRGSTSQRLGPLISRSSATARSSSETDSVSQLGAAEEHMEILSIRIQEVESQRALRVSPLDDPATHPPSYTSYSPVQLS